MGSEMALELAFYAGDYAKVLKFTYSDYHIRLLEFHIRSLLVLGRSKEAQARLESDRTRHPSIEALKALTSQSTEKADEVLAMKNINDGAKHLVALTHAVAGNYETALSIASTAPKNLDACLLRVHLLLAANLDKKAQEVVNDMRVWANDHVAYNIAEALVSLRADETAQKAFFIFEENNSILKTPNSVLGEGVSQMKLRRFLEASLPIKEAAESGSEAALISALTLALAQGDLNSAQSLRAKLLLEKFTQTPTNADIKEREDAFSRVQAKFSAFA